MKLFSIGSWSEQEQIAPTTTDMGQSVMGSLELAEVGGFKEEFGSGLGKGIGITLGFGLGIWLVSMAAR